MNEIIDIRSKEERRRELMPSTESVLQEANVRFWCDAFAPALFFGIVIFGFGVLIGAVAMIQFAERVLGSK